MDIVVRICSSRQSIMLQTLQHSLASPLGRFTFTPPHILPLRAPLPLLCLSKKKKFNVSFPIFPRVHVYHDRIQPQQNPPLKSKPPHINPSPFPKSLETSSSIIQEPPSFLSQYRNPNMIEVEPFFHGGKKRKKGKKGGNETPNHPPSPNFLLLFFSGDLENRYWSILIDR